MKAEQFNRKILKIKIIYEDTENLKTSDPRPSFFVVVWISIQTMPAELFSGYSTGLPESSPYDRDGYFCDCDFNQQLDMPRPHVTDFDLGT